MDKNKKELLKERIESFVVGYLDSLGYNFPLDIEFTYQTGFDSLDMVDLTIAIEQEFWKEIGEKGFEAKDFEDCHTLNEIISKFLQRAEKAGTI